MSSPCMQMNLLFLFSIIPVAMAASYSGHLFNVHQGYNLPSVFTLTTSVQPSPAACLDLCEGDPKCKSFSIKQFVGGYHPQFTCERKNAIILPIEYLGIADPDVYHMDSSAIYNMMINYGYDGCYEGSCYQVVHNAPLNRVNSEAACTARGNGGHLMYVESRGEADFIKAILRERYALNGAKHFYLGTYRNATTQDHHWSNGIPVNEYIQDWCCNQPVGNEACVAYYRDSSVGLFEWHDVYCSGGSAKGYICEEDFIAP